MHPIVGILVLVLIGAFVRLSLSWKEAGQKVRVLLYLVEHAPSSDDETPHGDIFDRKDL